ncbi:MAG: amidohydrolase [Abitibacteriaceae bacterium]|nr:amidohydrolase [Abditibacteriaceae bacterium]
MPTNTPTLQEKFVPPSLDLPWEQDIIALRRDFHTHPELGYEEVRTAGIVAERLRALGLEVRTGVADTGVIGLLRGGKSGPTILVRADMDALPVAEANAWEWKSSTHGKMHACGHDAHMATALTVARLLAQEKEDLAGTIKFMFQPAEEGLGGAKRMIEEGLLDDPRPDYALALHVWSDVEVGKVALKTGPVMACADAFTARIVGKGGHGAIPQQTIDPVVIASQIVLALQTTISRSIDPLQPAVVTVGKVWAGSAFNVIPGEAHLEGTVRSFDEGIRTLLERRCREIVEELPKAFGAKGEFHYERGYPATVNNPQVTEMVQRAIVNELGEDSVIEFTPTMGAEDMSLVLQQVPGCYFFVGGRNPVIDAVYPHHHPQFNIDEKALGIGVRAMIAAVKECLKQ